MGMYTSGIVAIPVQQDKARTVLTNPPQWVNLYELGTFNGYVYYRFPACKWYGAIGGILEDYFVTNPDWIVLTAYEEGGSSYTQGSYEDVELALVDDGKHHYWVTSPVGDSEKV